MRKGLKNYVTQEKQGQDENYVIRMVFKGSCIMVSRSGVRVAYMRNAQIYSVTQRAITGCQSTVYWAVKDQGINTL